MGGRYEPRSAGLTTVAGFTLVEFLIVAAILATFAALAVPALTAADPERADLAAAQLVQALRFARSEANRTGKHHGVRVDSAAERVQVFRLDSTSPVTRNFAVYHPVTRKQFLVDYAANRRTANVGVAAVTLNFASTCSEARDVVFDARGTPRCSDPVNVELTSATIDLAGPRVTRRVVVSGVTGRVALQ